MKLHQLTIGEPKGYTTWGCMWEKGEYEKDTSCICKNKAGEEVPMQTRITAYWPDGSVKWTAHTADSGRLGKEIEVLPRERKVPEEPQFTGDPQSQMALTEETDRILIDAGELSFVIDKRGETLFERAALCGQELAFHAKPVLLLEEPLTIQGNPARVEKAYDGQIEEVEIEERGNLFVLLKFTGCHRSREGERKFPFIIRMKIAYGCREIFFTHTFLYDGDENRDFLKGLGIDFQLKMKGAAYNRHIKVMGDHGVFHEVSAPLTAWHPITPRALYQRQMSGEVMELSGEEKEIAEQILRDSPLWSEYEICQDSPTHFDIRKKLALDNACYIDCLHGGRTRGGMAVGSEAGSVILGIQDFWEKYPSGYTVKGLEKDSASCTLWLWSPAAEAMDFRHYADRGYSQVCYEGYDYMGATPYGIACTSECGMAFCEAMIPEDEEIIAFAGRLDHPVRYVGEPAYYHERGAFGFWSLPSYDTQMERWLEEQLEKAFAFYQNEVEQRGWYGMFNYGDFMHSYDVVRHKWKYDMGGYAWDNTELVPTLWLWLYFLRTGREDVFRLAEKLSRHTSEVDVYHMGKYKGLGSRHNVRHWGCPCKEARIAMAGHHRVYYYLTGDYRMEDIFEELADNEMSFLNKDPLGDFYDKKDMVYPSHARTGPDWSSLCSNWMTKWERFLDERYRRKIETGIADIKNTPFGLVSGPRFEFDPQTCHLRYIGEVTNGNVHLQVCMGAPQIWMELAELLEDEEWKRLLAEYGRFYYLPKEEQISETGGAMGNKGFTFPFMAAAMGAYGAAYLRDDVLAGRTWKHLLKALLTENDHNGFESIELKDQGNQSVLTEIPWVSTNFVAQFCLNVIMALAFIREKLPATLQEAKALVSDGDTEEHFHKA
ncbi:MAG: hypothetical protein NC417_13815 [Candidatus Gastranaerophilales bacterium]|nr:hypothetical protein [Candidatus Gastranaerophilales bacterium]